MCVCVLECLGVGRSSEWPRGCVFLCDTCDTLTFFGVAWGMFLGGEVERTWGQLFEAFFVSGQC